MVKLAKVFSRKVIAEILCLSEKRVKQLTDEGVLIEITKGHYSLKDSVQSYIKYLQNMISDRDYGSDYNIEKAKLTKVKREKEEMQLKIINGEVHKSEDIERVIGNMLIAFKSKMLTVSQKVVPKLLNTNDKNETTNILNNEILEALSELIEYDKELFNSKEA